MKFGDFKFHDIPLIGHLIFDTAGNYFIVYNFHDPLKGFFMDFFMFSNLIWVNLAFDGGDSQLCYDGIYSQGFNEISPIFPTIFEPDHKDEDLSELSELVPKDFKNQLLADQRKNIKINNQKYLKENSNSNNELKGSRVSVTKYGVVHESCDFGVSYPEDLPDDYWEPWTSINIGIYRYLPTEAQVKSDLRIYNKDHLYRYSQDILAYTIGTHGGPHWEIWVKVWWWQEWAGDIYPNEVSALWYTDPEGFIDMHPWNTIIIVDVCYGYYKPPSTNPTMAKAFVDYGAAAFVGATIGIPWISDTYMRAFWHDLCQDNENVRTATITLCDTHGNGWNLGDEWRIYGNQYKTLP